MIVSPCRADGCSALTIGSYCVDHDLPVTRVFVRGRPFVATPTRRVVAERVIAPARTRPARTASTLSA